MSTAAPPAVPQQPAPPAQRNGRITRPDGLLRRVLWPRRIPGQIRVLAIASLLTVAVLFVVASIAFGHARQGIAVVGHEAGPQAAATGEMYFALSDMDSQVASVLLMGREELGGGRAAALKEYEKQRSKANLAVLQAAELSRDDRTVQAVLDGLGKFERLAERAMTQSRLENRPAGKASEKVLGPYREATDLMRLEILPKAYNLTLDSGATVRQTYEAERSALATTLFWVVITGIVALLTLVGLQVFLNARFRRRINPFLVLATIVALLLVVMGFGSLSNASEQLRLAKEEGFDSVLALSQTRAISNSAQADQVRFLLDKKRADTYDQVYLDKSQTIMYVEVPDPSKKGAMKAAGNLSQYYGAVDDKAGMKGLGEGAGFLGNEAASGKHRDTVSKVVSGYVRFQLDDQSMRKTFRAGDARGAIASRMGQYAENFNDYDDALVGLSKAHQKSYSDAVAAGDGALSGWDLGLPLAAGAIAILVLLGVRPRLAEYR